MENVKCLREIIKDFIHHASELKEMGIITNEMYEHLTENKKSFLENNTYS